MNKKADTIVLETIIFIVLNLIFFVAMLWFVYGSGKGAFIYEQVYAKQIALLIDDAKPNMTLGLNIEKGIEIAEENGKSVEKIVSIDDKEKKVIVSLSDKGGYVFQYFSDYNIETRITENYLTIKLWEKEK